MPNYTELKDAFLKEKKTLKEKLEINESLLNKYRKIINIINDCVSENNDSKINIDSINRLIELKKFFPNLSLDFKRVERMNSHRWLIFNDLMNKFDPRELVNDIQECAKIYNFPSNDTIEQIKKNSFALIEIKMMANNHMKAVGNDFDDMVRKQAKKLAEVATIIDHVILYLANRLLSDVINQLKKQKDENSLVQEINDIRERLKLIDEFNQKFSNDKLLVKFENEEELMTFTKILESLFDSLKCKEILESISIDQKTEEKIEIKVDFDNIDMSKFNDTEIEIILKVREILLKEDLNDEDDTFANQNFSYNDRIIAYQNASITQILVDVKNNLISKIYENKDEIINIFKVVIDLYKKDIIRNTREDLLKELLRIRDDFNNIISFINKTYLDKSKAYEKTNIISKYINNIESEYIPLLNDLINSDYTIDDYYDKEFEIIIIKFKEIIKEYKKEMTIYNTNDEIIDESKEDTDNLVFCLSDDIDLTSNGFQKEFIGTISDLESKDSRDLKKRPGRKGMSKIRKQTENNKENDFASYLEKRCKIKIHFVPYRYSSDSNYRTGLIKFEPSSVVKKFLEEKYGLSKQSAYYGIFKIIQVVRADHSEYSYLEEYILDNYLKIEELAKLFASVDPDLEKLTSIIDDLLAIKHEKIDMINSCIKK